MIGYYGSSGQWADPWSQYRRHGHAQYLYATRIAGIPPDRVGNEQFDAEVPMDLLEQRRGGWKFSDACPVSKAADRYLKRTDWHAV